MEDIAAEPAAGLLAAAARQRSEIGVVIPTLDEEDLLPALLADLRRLDPPPPVVVVDGGSTDRTAKIARDRGAALMRAPPERARQLNAGAAYLGSPWLLFLHADSRLGAEAWSQVKRHVQRPGAGAAHFGIEIAHPDRYFRWIEAGQRVRERLCGLAYGDQGMLISRTLFHAVGGYPDAPFLEDVILVQRLLRRRQLRPLPARLPTSARRYLSEGRVRGFLRNFSVMARFLSGEDPGRLARRYAPMRRSSPSSEGPDDIASAPAEVLVFAKAPRPGAVKTRLARSIGDGAATSLYRRMGARIVEGILQSDAHVTVCYDPAGGEAEMREWLGEAGLGFRLQGGGSLGDRLERMFRKALRSRGKVLAVGADAPAVDADVIRLASAALDEADVVLGPAFDGGYYLIGLSRPAPELFRGISWSGPRVLADTLAKAARLGLAATLLAPRSDVDSERDLTPGMRRLLGI